MNKLEGAALDQALEMYIAKAKKRIKELYRDTDGHCYLSFSGGKDSTVVLALIKMCQEGGLIPENSIPAAFCDTKIELDATTDFVKWVRDNWYSNVVMLKTEKSFAQVIREYGKPALSKIRSQELHAVQQKRKAGNTEIFGSEYRLIGLPYTLKGKAHKRYAKIAIANKNYHFLHPDFPIMVSPMCCNEMKKKPIFKYATEHDMVGQFTGERLSEGGARAAAFEQKLKKGQNICTRLSHGFIVKTPIVDWPDEVLERFIEKYNVPMSRAYTEYGLTRTGCFLCPFSLNLKKNFQTLHEFEPLKYKAGLFFLKDVYIAQGLKLEFDEEYMKEFNETFPKYERMRYEMLHKYKPTCRLAKKYEKEHPDEVIKDDE